MFLWDNYFFNPLAEASKLVIKGEYFAINWAQIQNFGCYCKIPEEKTQLHFTRPENTFASFILSPVCQIEEVDVF